MTTTKKEPTLKESPNSGTTVGKSELPVETAEESITFNPGKIPEFRAAISRMFVHPPTRIQFWVRLEGSYPVDAGENAKGAAQGLLRFIMLNVEDAGLEQFRLLETGEVGQMTQAAIDAAVDEFNQLPPAIVEEAEYNQEVF